MKKRGQKRRAEDDPAIDPNAPSTSHPRPRPRPCGKNVRKEAETGNANDSSLRLSNIE